jgi:hypothetical protein
MKTIREYINLVNESATDDFKTAGDHLFKALEILDNHGQHKDIADKIYEILSQLNYPFPPGTGIK